MLTEADMGGPTERGGVGRVSYWLAIELPDRDADATQRLACWKLEEFVRASDVVVLRCLIAGLRFDPECYPEPVRALLPVALEKARNHEDEYVRLRLAIQLGESKGPFPMLVTR